MTNYVCVGDGAFHVVTADTKADAWDVIEINQPQFDCKLVLSEWYVRQMLSFLLNKKPYYITEGKIVKDREGEL
jgi:hypothetical protein